MLNIEILFMLLVLVKLKFDEIGNWFLLAHAFLSFYTLKEKMFVNVNLKKVRFPVLIDI